MGPLLLLAALSSAVPPAGEWRLDSHNTRVKVLAWGLFCGKEPTDSRGIPGARYTLTVSGQDFVLKGAGKTFSSNGCSMDPAAFKARTADRNEGVYRVECEAPPVAGQPQVNEHHFEVTEGAVRYVTKGERRKTENLEACRFAYETEMRFVLSSQAGPCSTPGPVSRLVVDPAAVDAKPGQRICFKVQGMDAQDCAVPATPTFSVEPAGRGDLDANGCLWTPREVTESLVLAVSVSSGTARGGAVVRVAGEGAPKESMEQTVARAGGEVAKKLISQVTAGDFVIKTPQDEEEEPAAVLPPPPVTTEKEGFPLWLLAAGFGAFVLLAGAAFFLLRGGKKEPPRPPAPVVPIFPAPAPGKGWQCPKCKFEYASAGTCVHDGSTLVKNESAGRQTMFIPEVGGMMCPTCGQRFPSRARFCGNDRSPLVPDLPK
jgi:hypothetical protein